MGYDMFKCECGDDDGHRSVNNGCCPRAIYGLKVLISYYASNGEMISDAVAYEGPSWVYEPSEKVFFACVEDPKVYRVELRSTRGRGHAIDEKPWRTIAVADLLYRRK